MTRPRFDMLRPRRAYTGPAGSVRFPHPNTEVAAMGLLRWFTKNWANTTEPTHADLRPLALPGPRAEAVVRLKAAAGTLRGWTLEAETAEALHFVRRTRAFRFADDIRLALASVGNVVRVDAESRSRLGKGDLGQNRRNIRELWAAVGATSAARPG